MIKQCITFVSVLILLVSPVYSLEFDTSIDAEIKRKYNTNKLEYDVLPNLPKVNSTSGNSNIPKTPLQYTEEKPQITVLDPKTGVKIPKWTKFKATSNQTLSNNIKTGTIVSFTTTEPVYKII